MKNKMSSFFLYKNIMMNSLINLPTPMNINLWWNFGSILGIMLMTQISTGLFLSFYYCANINYAFISIMYMNLDMNYGWLIRYLHVNGASMFFICIYIHIGRNIYYNTFINKYTWLIGVLILFMLMATAFIGYVLPWGQMSYWGATVITNLLSALPFITEETLMYLWGGYSIDNPTLTRFYSLHFLVPLIMVMLIMLHLLSLHQFGSSNPLGMTSNLMKIPFHDYFSIKDLMGFNLFYLILIMMCLKNPTFFLDPENYSEANVLQTPNHIQPEWYFLFAYTILRAIPNKMGGVISMLMAILILAVMPFYNFNNKFQTNNMFIINKMYFWWFIFICVMLTWIGMNSTQYPYSMIGKLLSILYFMYYLTNPLIHKIFLNLMKI